MRTDKALAIKLRLQGQSYGQIQGRLRGISKSTLSTWLRDVVLSGAAREIILRRTREQSLAGLLKRNRHQTFLADQRKRKVRTAAKSEIPHLSHEQLFLIGVTLYWAEGYKRPIVRDGRETTYHPVSLTNSDSKLVKIFIEFLTKVCGASFSKIKANVRIFRHLNETAVLDYWIRETGLPKENFTKTSVPVSKSSVGKRPFNRLPFGVIQIRISDTNLFHRIMGWIEGIKDSIDNPIMPR